MTEVVGREGGPAAQVVIGVDTHQHQHVAVAIHRQGVRLAECHAPATTCGYGELERWSLSLGRIRAFGIEARVEKDISSSSAASAFVTQRTGLSIAFPLLSADTSAVVSGVQNVLERVLYFSTASHFAP